LALAWYEDSDVTDEPTPDSLLLDSSLTTVGELAPLACSVGSLGGFSIGHLFATSLKRRRQKMIAAALHATVLANITKDVFYISESLNRQATQLFTLSHWMQRAGEIVQINNPFSCPIYLPILIKRVFHRNSSSL
jgi:hypothetical protein